MKTKIRVGSLRALFVALLLVVASTLLGAGSASATSSVDVAAPTTAQGGQIDCLAWKYPGVEHRAYALCLIRQTGWIRVDAFCRSTTGRIWLAHGGWVLTSNQRMSALDCGRSNRITWHGYTLKP